MRIELAQKTPNARIVAGVAEGALMVEQLYHYCSTPTAFAILQNRTIRLSPLSSANDSLEGRLVGRVFGDLLSKSGLPPGVVDVASVIVSAYPDATEGFAFCLSEEDDLLSQWRAYGRDATGLSIGFDVEALKTDFGKVDFGSQFFELIKVGYGSDGLHELIEPIVANVRATFQKHGDFIRLSADLTREKALAALTDREGDIRGLFVGRDRHATELLAKLSEALAGMHFKVYGTKPQSFHEEKEWRLLRYRHRVVHPEVEYFADDASIRPYIPCLLAEPAWKAIRTVILGPKHRSDINWLRAFLESVGLSHVKVRRSAIESYR